jgi:hypothetical protein
MMMFSMHFALALATGRRRRRASLCDTLLYAYIVAREYIFGSLIRVGAFSRNCIFSEYLSLPRLG